VFGAHAALPCHDCAIVHRIAPPLQHHSGRPILGPTLGMQPCGMVHSAASLGAQPTKHACRWPDWPTLLQMHVLPTVCMLRQPRCLQAHEPTHTTD
jgi:hypothetical protein